MNAKKAKLLRKVAKAKRISYKKLKKAYVLKAISITAPPARTGVKEGV